MAVVQRTVQHAVLSYSPPSGGFRTAQRGAVIELSEEDAARFDENGATVVGEVRPPAHELARRVGDGPDDADGQVPVTHAVSTGDPDADARVEALRFAAAASRGIPLGDDIEDIDAPGADTALDTVNPNAYQQGGPLPVGMTIEPEPSGPVTVPAGSPFDAVSTQPAPAAPSSALPRKKPMRVNSKGEWISYVLSLPAKDRNGATEQSLTDMTKVDIVGTWG